MKFKLTTLNFLKTAHCTGEPEITQMLWKIGFFLSKYEFSLRPSTLAYWSLDVVFVM
jgi:hypothetical protein